MNKPFFISFNFSLIKNKIEKGCNKLRGKVVFPRIIEKYW